MTWKEFCFDISISCAFRHKFKWLSKATAWRVIDALVASLPFSIVNISLEEFFWKAACPNRKTFIFIYQVATVGDHRRSEKYCFLTSFSLTGDKGHGWLWYVTSDNWGQVLLCHVGFIGLWTYRHWKYGKIWLPRRRSCCPCCS